MRALILLLLCASGQLCANECDKLQPPSVTLKRLDEPVSLDTSYSYKSITVLASTLHRPENRVLGLTRGIARVKFEAQTTSFADPTGRWECASPKISVTYGFSPMTVYVAKEFPKGSCAYNEIYQHELRHVKTHQDHLISIEKDIADTLTRRFATGSVWRGPVGQARMTLERELNERWAPYITREIERVESAQALIDTPEEYARVADSCNGEIKRLTR
jgi:hypothetical protein